MIPGGLPVDQYAQHYYSRSFDPENDFFCGSTQKEKRRGRRYASPVFVSDFLVAESGRSKVGNLAVRQGGRLGADSCSGVN